VLGLILFPLPSLKILSLSLLFAGLGGLGTTVCYHRLLAHRTLKLNKLIEHGLIFFAIFNASGAPASWVAYHRRHHSRTDGPEDISSPKQGGFWWAHLRWLYQSAPADRARWCPELDRGMYQVLDRCRRACNSALAAFWPSSWMARIFLVGRDTAGLFSAHAVPRKQLHPSRQRPGRRLKPECLVVGTTPINRLGRKLAQESS
jgi:fatty-acid desaturase